MPKRSKSLKQNTQLKLDVLKGENLIKAIENTKLFNFEPSYSLENSNLSLTIPFNTARPMHHVQTQKNDSKESSQIQNESVPDRVAIHKRTRTVDQLPLLKLNKIV